MESEVQNETVSPDLSAENVTVKLETPGSVTSLSTDSADDQWKDIGEKVSDFLADLPAYLSDFFGEYKRPIINIGLFIGVLVAVKLLLAVLSAINDLPLFSSLFELIGISYTVWFVWRYLLKASSREQLSSDFSALKEQILGK